MSPDEAFSICEQLIENGSMSARIETVSGEVSLRFLQAEKPETELYENLKSQINRITALTDYVSLADGKLMSTREYAKAVRLAKLEEITKEEGKENMAAGLGDMLDEENLMDESIGMDES
jgi:hypothetical protein